MTSLTTMYGAHENKERFLDYQQRFYRTALEQAKKADFKGYVFGDGTDPARLQGMLDILQQHGIQAHPLTADVTIDKVTYRAANSYYVPLAQPQYTLIRAIFNSDQNFRDNTFYDVSGWTLPMAFNVPFAQFDGRSIKYAEQAYQAAPVVSTSALPADAYAYAFSWHGYFAPRALQQLLSAGIHVRQADQPFSARTTNGEQSFDMGAVVVTRAYQQHDWADVQQQLSAIAAENQLTVHAITTGLTPTGIDLGSRDLRPVEPISVMMLVGNDADMYEAGEAWYYLDRHVGVPVSLVDTDRFNRIDLNRYSHIILVDGSYRSLGNSGANRLQQWVNQGGVVIGQKGGARWLAENDILAAKFVANDAFDAKFDTSTLSFADRDSYYGQRRVAGAIFGLDLDLSHPLLAGFPRANLPIFKDSLLAMEIPEQPFLVAARYQQQPLLSGYAAVENREVLSQKAAIVGHRKGQGRVIAFTDDVNFRAYFWGTAKLLSNAIFMAPAVSPSANADEDAADAEAAAAEAAHAH